MNKDPMAGKFLGREVLSPDKFFKELNDEELDKILDVKENAFDKSMKADEEEAMEIVKKIEIVRTAIRDKHPRGSKFIEDNIVCPLCKDGKVHFVISDHYNGHIHAACSNKCINWCE